MFFHTSPVAILISAVMRAALQTVDRLVKIIADHSSMVADVYSLGGDCYAKLGRDDDARRYYNLSYAKDWIVNYWAISRLAGE